MLLLNKRKSTKSNQKRNLIAFSHPDSILAENFRGIRTNIRFLKGKGKKSTLLITSPTSGEGKSTIVANLAVSMAQQKEKVLLIDANLRDPLQHFIFRTPNSEGLTEVLTGKMSFSDAVFQTEIGRLDILSSGALPHNPTELIGSDMMGDFLLERLKDYDVILLDSPGILEVSDAKILAGKCDGVILVVGEGKTEVSKVIESKKDLEFAKANIMGVIVNELK
jgi:capsular exopolysaccharide synthesis family protein